MFISVNLVKPTRKTFILVPLAAAAGGFTTVVMMANTSPTISDGDFFLQSSPVSWKERLMSKMVATITKNFNGWHLTDFKGTLEAVSWFLRWHWFHLKAAKWSKEIHGGSQKTFISLHEEDQVWMGFLDLMKISLKNISIFGATGVAEYAMMAWCHDCLCN